MLATGDELVNNHLGTVGEVAELGFPDNQCIRLGGRITVFERQYRFFRQQGVVQVETWLTFVQILQRNVGSAIFLVMQRRMAVRERTTADVLTGHANRMTFECQGRVRHGFGVTPVDRQAANLHFLTIFVDLRHLTLNHEAFWQLHQFGGQFLQGLQVETGVVTSSPGMAQIWTPIDEQFFVRLFDQAFYYMQTVVQRIAIVVDFCLHARVVENTSQGQALGIQLASGALFGNLLVHQRLGTAWFVSFVVATTTVADQIDHHVTLELHAVVDGQLGHKHDGFRVITIHMENRRLNHLGNVGCVLSGARVFRVADGEANLVVDDDMDRAARLEAASLRHLEGFQDHALTCERSVTVDGNWQNLVTGRIVTTILTCTHRPFYHRRNDLQVRRVECHRQVDFATGCHHVGRKALVIFNVTGTELDLFLAFELVEQIARVLAEGVDQDVQTSPVGHADHDFFGAVRARTLDQLIQHRDQAFAAFQTETLGAGVFGTQVFFQAFSGSHALEQVALDVSGERWTPAHAFEALHKPVTLLGIDNMGKFRANGAAICLLQRFENFA